MADKNILHYRYNFFYVVIICIVSIILLVTVEWGSINELERLIAFGLTLTSLFLSLIAIVFAIFSNFSFSKSSMKLQESSSQISGMTQTLHDATEGIKQQLKNLPDIVKGLEHRFEEGHKEVIEKISENQQINSQETPPIDLPDTQVKKFLDKSSYDGLVMLYACKLAYDSNTPFKFDKIPLRRDYAYGFLVASYAMGFVKYVFKDNIFNITEINDDLSKTVKKAMGERLHKIYENAPEEIDEEKKKIKDMERYFKDA